MEPSQGLGAMGSHVGWRAAVHAPSLAGLPDPGVAVWHQRTHLLTLSLPL